MSKLHELLAVDGNLKGQAEKCRTDLQNTFEKKRHLFQSKLVTMTPDEEGKLAETREQSDIQTSVVKEVQWLQSILVRSLDASFAIDLANTAAKADIVLSGGDILAKDVPATALLQLEKRVKEVITFVKTIPTLDPAKGFTPDPAREAGIFRARDVSKSTTQKVEDFQVIVPATKEHPAQVAKLNKDVKVGTILEQEWSSLITPAKKAELLERGEELLRAVAQARSRANGHEVDTASNKIGSKLLSYVFEPLTTP